MFKMKKYIISILVAVAARPGRRQPYDNPAAPRYPHPMIDDRFDHKSAEARLYEAWESSGAFKPSGEGAPNAIVGDDPPDQQGRSAW